MVTQIPELKETLEEFRQIILESAENDEEYEADEVIAAMDRVQSKLKNVESQEQFKKLMGDFGWDFFTVFFAVQEILELEDECMFEDEDCDDDEYECEDCDCEDEEE